ncbi:hypothetical protein J5U46_25365 [Micromonospora tulbaghiae]|uniref:Uncharacterized protein n=2 Tax=Micromonospora tulbaghiae TaxID=479978 RepID=A0AAW4JPQ3_9ACTN|nr:hypothetical protein [Micromonospora tulbaghiae]SCF09404.1 hypothetical protein GA0070562_0030 [Micromonospora tulbaghiae]
MRRRAGQAHNAVMSEPAESFTDQEYAFLRHVRFGELPARVRPEERIEAAETEFPPDRPDPVGGESEWHLRAGG